MRRWKRILTIVAALILLGVAYRVLGVYEFRSGECSARQPRRFANTYPTRLVVMSYNIEGHASLLRGDHIEEIAEVIRRHRPDIVGLNEAHRGTWQARFGDHVNELGRLTGMNVVFGRSYTFLGGHFGNAVLARGAITRSEVHELPGVGEPRTLLESIVSINGGVIEFYVTHTAAWATLNREARDLQLQCINDHINASAHPFIVTGDLNAPPDAPEIAKFLAGNALQLAGDPKTPTHRVMEQRLDYILADRGWQVRNARVLDDGPSDHRPVIAELVHP
ncbi:MAG TPA: endonuclease/exonuclease/phosphatase family protein [Thermoanaerobaculia bacterium]|nr:endonuclease/exonuclease/phosphatase family protein [Thermoanaerobaculia bacterium]